MEKKEFAVITYFKFLLKELVSPLNYLIAFIIGVVINFFQGLGIFESFVPFIVPIIVQSISKASVKFSNRNINVLVRLPMERKDPAFVMNYENKIIAYDGNTKNMLKSANINQFNDFFNESRTDFIKQIIVTTCESHKHESFEMYSEKLKKWFLVNMKEDATSPNILVWLDDISLRKKLNDKLQHIKNFSKQMMLGVKELLKNNTSYDRLAKFVLDEGYSGVFITNILDNGDLSGHVFKIENNSIIKSDKIIISKDSEAPIWESRKNKGIVTNTKRNFKSDEEFNNSYKFDKNVLKFLDFSIDNFVNYHEENISFIAFNKSNSITKYDLTVMEAVVTSAFTINYLISLFNQSKN